MSEITNWYHESTTTQSYTAAPGHQCDTSLKEFLQTAGALFATATDAYFNSAYSSSLTMEGLNPAQPESWLQFAGRLITGYTKAHYELINEDESYRYGLGELMDTYREMHGGKRPNAKGQDRRYRHQGHTLVKDAILEGVHTITAVYPLPVDIARRTAEPELELIRAALPGAVALAQRLARHSKQGNERFIQAAARPTSFIYGRRIHYKRLQYDPSRFRLLSEGERPTVALAVDAHEASDTTRYFSGCPAILGGSVAALNRAIANTIVTEGVYERMLGQKELK